METSSDISILVLDKNFLATYAISEFYSFIWTERYYRYGDFELESIFTIELFNNLKIGNYIWINGSNTLMVVEKIQIAYDAADRSNQKLIYSGRTIESILDRRVIWGAWSFGADKSIRTNLFQLVSDNATNPTDSKRRIDIFTLNNVADPDVDKHKVAASGYADDLYDVIQAVCESEGIGFRAIYTDGSSRCILEFYEGKDRSYGQMKLPPVIFSANYENLGNTRYGVNTQEYKTIAYAYGPEETLEIKDENGEVIGEIKDRTVMTVGAQQLSGLNRYEISVSATSSYPEDIQQAAMEKIAKLDTLDVLDAELDAKRQFVYARDFFMGDIVQIVTEFGLDARARVTEFTRSWAPEGYTEVPTFEVMEEDAISTQTLSVSRAAI